MPVISATVCMHARMCAGGADSGCGGGVVRGVSDEVEVGRSGVQPSPVARQVQ